MTPRYKLRTLLILLAIVPPLMWIGWVKWLEYREHLAEQHRREMMRKAQPVLRVVITDGGTVNHLGA